ncbi:MAG: NUDIX hydrolase [Lapillicoccus sp.]
MPSVIPAAGTVPWRRRRGALEVAVVHRPKYDDWSWPKGKLDPGEDWPVAAVRETEEETGLEVRLGIPLPPTAYTVLDRMGQPASKQVRYWAAEVVGGAGHLENEIDEVSWLDVSTAHDKLDYARDREQLRAVVRADTEGNLTTWPLVIVRHAKARSRSSWSHDDPLRPLDARGIAQAGAIVPLLAAFGISRLVSSPSKRCVDTLRPYAAALSLPLKLRDGLSEEGFASEPDRAVRHLRRALDRGAATAICSHGPVLPTLLETLRHYVDLTSEEGKAADACLSEAADGLMAKGEVLVCHTVSTGATARIIAVERHGT